MTRRSQVLPFTLTEIFVLLFFALTLALVWQSMARAKAEAEAAAAMGAISSVHATLGPSGMEELALIVAHLQEEIPDDFTELVRAVHTQATKRELLERRLLEANVDTAWVRSASTSVLLDTLLAMYDHGTERAEQLEEALEYATGGPEPLQACLADLGESERERGALQVRADACRPPGGTGLVHPPCWADANGQIEYAFTVVMRTHSVTLTPSWPAYRQADARGIQGMIEAAATNMTYSDMSNRSLPIFQWSAQQKPECRHFVRIIDEVEGKDAFKQNLLTVERYFYKKLMD